MFMVIHISHSTKCVNWSIQDYSLLFNNSFDTWTKGWELSDLYKTNESINFTSILDEEIKNYSNFTINLEKNDLSLDFKPLNRDSVVDDLSFNTFDESSSDQSVVVFGVENNDLSFEEIF